MLVMLGDPSETYFSLFYYPRYFSTELNADLNTKLMTEVLSTELRLGSITV
jgi:hypothetical protein